MNPFGAVGSRQSEVGNPETGPVLSVKAPLTKGAPPRGLRPEGNEGRIGFETRRSDLKPEVRGYADKLYANIQEIYRKHDVTNAKELHLAMAEGRTKVVKAEALRLKRLVDDLDRTLSRNEIVGLMTELAKEYNANYAVSNGRVFVNSSYYEDIVDMDGSVDRVWHILDHPLDKPDVFVEDEEVVIGDGQMFIRKNGILLNEDGEGVDLAGIPNNFHDITVSGGKWFAFASNDEGGRDVYELERGQDWSKWPRIYGRPEHRPFASDFRIDGGKLYAGNVAKDENSDESEVYKSTIKEIGTDEVVYDGPWDEAMDWRMSDGILYLKKKQVDGRIVFLRNGVRIFESWDKFNIAYWSVDHGVLYLTLETGDDKNTRVLYRVNEPQS